MTDVADPIILATFDRICAVVSERGRGVSLADLSAAWTALRSRLGVHRETVR